MSESAVVYSLCGFCSVMPGTCQSHQKWEKAVLVGFFFCFFVFMRRSCVFHLMSCLIKEEKREKSAQSALFSGSDRP